MPSDRQMTKIMESELQKIRNFPRFYFHSFAYPTEIEAARKRLKDSGINFRTKPVYENSTGVLIGYNIYVNN